MQKLTRRFPKIIFGIKKLGPTWELQQPEDDLIFEPKVEKIYGPSIVELPPRFITKIVKRKFRRVCANSGKHWCRRN
jgi:hypothetical protein